MVPNSSKDVARALRGQPAPRLSRNCLRRNGGNVIVVVLVSFHSRNVLVLSAVLFVRPCFRLLFTRLAVLYLGAYSVLYRDLLIVLPMREPSIFRGIAVSLLRPVIGSNVEIDVVALNWFAHVRKQFAAGFK